MNVFDTCLPKRTGTRIYLPEDEEEEERTSCFSCCLWTRNKYQEGLIRLPEGRRTIDDYLDPRSPVSIEVLLAEQEEELDHYLGQTDDEDAFINSRRKYSFVNNTFLEEDAQFLSEHRISAILVDRPKLGSANIFQSENIESPPNNQQELLEVVMPVVSTSTSSISSRVFAIKTQPEEKSTITDVINITTSPQEIGSHIIPSPSSSTSSILSTSTMDNNYVPPVGSSTSLSVFPVASSSTRISDFPATTLTRTPYQPIPIIHHDIIPALVNIPKTPPQPILPHTGRRPSVVAVAQSLLGDKLDDFTEKLAFIKKNIIMSMDSEEEEELTENNHFYNTNTLNKNRKSLNGRDISGPNTWDNFVLPKFKKQASVSTSFLQQKTNAVPLSVTQRRVSNASSFSDEEPFDFSTVGKNVRTFGEGVMGNGLRMFNNLSTRIKNHNDK